MKMLVSFKKPGSGMSKVLLTTEEVLRFTNGVARRIPPNKEGVFNSIPIKYITSIKILETSAKCGSCGNEDNKLICTDCLEKLVKKK